LTYKKMKENEPFVNKSLRLKEYDYSHPGVYFVTICVNDRKCLFGEVMNGKMILNGLGKIADKCIIDIPHHFENTEIAEYVVMPNHVHAVIKLYDNLPVGQTHAFDSQRRAFDLQVDRKRQKLPIIMGSYKSAVSKDIHKLCSSEDFKWQTSYHDHIIRNEKALENICEYIRLNPGNWDTDLENEEHINELSAAEREKRIKQFYKELVK
jgi:REP-associated tyrosine transposase